MPTDPRRELDLLPEHDGLLGCALWQAVSDVLLWSQTEPRFRSSVFQTTCPESDFATSVVSEAPELAVFLRTLHSVVELPELVDATAVADACAGICAWAEAKGLKETALHFAEAAARVDPENASRCHVAGRLCRRKGEYVRASIWLRRAIRLARRARRAGFNAKNEIDFANAHRGYGFLLADQGRMKEAEPHFWKCVRAAKRAGRHSLMGTGFHDLFLVAVHLERWDDALRFAKNAVSFYENGHPRFPLLAHDLAFFWNRLGYYSSALPVVEKVLPFVGHLRERILVLATLARSAAAVRDHLRFQRAAREVIALAKTDSEMSASSLYHLAEGARCFQDWEFSEQLARMALEAAHARKNGTIIGWAEALLSGAIPQHLPGDYDTIPEDGSAVDEIRELILEKLKKQPPPDLSGAVPLERYPA